MLTIKAEALGRIKNAAAAQAADTDRLVAKGDVARPFAQACRAELDGTLDLLRDAYRVVQRTDVRRRRQWINIRHVGRKPEGVRTISESLAAWDTWRGNDRLAVEPGDGEPTRADLVIEALDEERPALDLGADDRDDQVGAWNEWQARRMAALARVAGCPVRPNGRTFLGLPFSSGSQTLVWMEATRSPKLGLISLQLFCEEAKEVFTSSEIRVDWSEAVDPPEVEVDGGLGYRPDADLRERQLFEGAQLLVARIAEDAVLLTPAQVDAVLLAKEAEDAVLLAEREPRRWGNGIAPSGVDGTEPRAGTRRPGTDRDDALQRRLNAAADRFDQLLA